MAQWNNEKLIAHIIIPPTMDKQWFSQGTKTKKSGMLLQIIIGVNYLRWSAPRRLPNIKNAYGNQKTASYMKNDSDEEFFKKREKK